VCAIIERNGGFLAAKRAAHQTNGLLWEFPGGKVMEGETAECALVRELREELGIEVRIVKRLPTSFHEYPWISIDLVPFICSLTSGEPQPHEHAELRWIDKKESSALEWAPADVPVLEGYLAQCNYSSRSRRTGALDM
jgi:8-oxo-dGTP diphosphatase